MRLASLVLVLSALIPLAAAQDPLDSSPRPEGDQSAATQPAHHETVVVTGTPQPVPLEEADRSVTVYEMPARVLLFGSISQALALDSSIALGERAPNGIQ